MKVIECEQGTDEWRQARAGKVTASCIDKVLATIKSGEAAARRDYRAQILAEVLTGKPQDSDYMNDEMRWGQDCEGLARSAYEIAKDCDVRQVGLVLHPTIERAAMSPDGLLQNNGLLEIKSPKTATHLQYLLAGEVPAKYQPQMLWQMACAEATFCDFVSFDPRLSPELQLFVVRFHRDEDRIKAMESEVRKFLLEVDLMLAALSKLQGLVVTERGKVKVFRMTAPTSDTPIVDAEMFDAGDKLAYGTNSPGMCVTYEVARRLERTANLLREALLLALRLECPGTEVHCVDEAEGKRSQAKAALAAYEALKP